MFQRKILIAEVILPLLICISNVYAGDFLLYHRVNFSFSVTTGEGENQLSEKDSKWYLFIKFSFKCTNGNF